MQKLPDVISVSGVFFDPVTSMVQLQYESSGGPCELRIPLDQLLRSEDWFIQLRQKIGQAHPQRDPR